MKISVIMGIYNCENTLETAIECILQQTFTDWQLIMCDDGSTDNTGKIAQKYVEKYPEKILLLFNKKNYGLNYTLNKCLKVAQGEYIARMDGDDLCSPERFQKEVDILENEPDISIVSSNMTFFDENGTWGQTYKKLYPTKKDFIKTTPFCHAPCMVRREAYEKVHGYTEKKHLLRVEDYHLWMKMYKAGYRGKNIPEPLYYMRDDRNAYNRRKFRYRINEVYIRVLAVKELELPRYGYIYSLRPIVVGLMPRKIYDLLHKRRLKKKN